MIEIILAIVMALISYFTAKEKGGASDGEAALVAGLAGAGTYYATTETEWGRESVDFLDEAIFGSPSDTVDVNTQTGTVTYKRDADGNYVPIATGGVQSGGTSGVWDTLKSWGPVGTAGVLGVGAGAVTGKTDWLLIGGIALAAILILK